MSLISVIIPVYNSELHLERCLNSIKQQKYKQLEVLLVNDGSKDKSAEICKRFCDEDCRFKYFYQENAGASAARNIGLKNATGDYIGFCDSDDWLDCDYIEKLFDPIKSSNADVVVGGFTLHDGEREISCSVPEKPELLSRQQFADRFWEFQSKNLINSTCNKLYKRTIVNQLFREDMSCGEDMQFNMLNLTAAERFAMVDTAGYYYFQEYTQQFKYPKNNAKQCFLYSDSVRQFLSSASPDSNYLGKYEEFLCGNICRDVCTLSLSNNIVDAKKMIEEFLTYPEFTNALQHKKWKGKGKKYEVVGKLLSKGIITPIILGVKATKL